MKSHLVIFERWYEQVKALAGHKRAEPILLSLSFAESSVFPIPVDLMLIPMVQARHDRAWRYAFWCSVASVLGGIAGYLLGMLFFDTIAEPILRSLGKLEKTLEFSETIEKYGGIGVFGAGLTPFPYKVITIMSGALKINFGIFVAASVLSRSLRFFLVAWAVKTFGDAAERILKQHLGKITMGLFGLVLIGWLVWTYGFGH